MNDPAIKLIDEEGEVNVSPSKQRLVLRYPEPKIISPTKSQNEPDSRQKLAKPKPTEDEELENLKEDILKSREVVVNYQDKNWKPIGENISDNSINKEDEKQLDNEKQDIRTYDEIKEIQTGEDSNIEKDLMSPCDSDFYKVDKTYIQKEIIKKILQLNPNTASNRDEKEYEEAKKAAEVSNKQGNGSKDGHEQYKENMG